MGRVEARPLIHPNIQKHVKSDWVRLVFFLFFLTVKLTRHGAVEGLFSRDSSRALEALFYLIDHRRFF